MFPLFLFRHITCSLSHCLSLFGKPVFLLGTMLGQIRIYSFHQFKPDGGVQIIFKKLLLSFKPIASIISLGE